MPTLQESAAAQIDAMIAKLKDMGIPLRVTSGYRDPAHNRAVGGASGSQHIHDRARDISLKGLTEPQKQAVVTAFQSEPAVRGFGYYPTSDSIHVDTRPSGKAAWGTSYGRESVGKGWPDWMTQSTRTWLGQTPTSTAAAPGPTLATTPTNPNLGVTLNSTPTPTPPVEPTTMDKFQTALMGAEGKGGPDSGLAGLTQIASGLGLGQKPVQIQSNAPPPPPQLDVNEGGSAQAQALMALLLQNRRNPQGVTLTSGGLA